MAQHLIPLWHLTATEAGLMASAFAIGYMLAVPVLTTLTDRIDARIILLIGSSASAAATSRSAFANDLRPQSIWGSPGSDSAPCRVSKHSPIARSGDISRSITLYTATFSFGVGLSFLIAQLVADTVGWRAAFYFTALGPLAMIVTALAMSPVQPTSTPRPFFDVKPVFRNRTALGYVLGYGAHCFELYALRTWIVAFWTYIAALNGGSAVLEPIAVSVVAAVLAMPASILGNEAAIRYGRQRVIVWFMCIAGLIAILIGLSTSASPQILLALLFVYSLAIPADSGALTSGMSASAVPTYRGATMALHSTVGFGLSAAGSWAVGLALDAGGGMDTQTGWLLAFLVMAAGGLLGPLALWWSRHAPDPSI
jgi:predicted MFS family arabinose efflux permease